MILSPNEIAYVARQAGFDPAEIPMAVAVALAESQGNTDALGHVAPTKGVATSGNYDHGLWQISSLWHGLDLSHVGAQWRDPYVNAALALQVFMNAKAKWSPWHTFTSGAALALLPFGTQAAKFPWAPPPSVAQVCQFQPTTLEPCKYAPDRPISLIITGSAYSDTPAP